jgi:hypothetical protein
MQVQVNKKRVVVTLNRRSPEQQEISSLRGKLDASRAHTAALFQENADLRRVLRGYLKGRLAVVGEPDGLDLLIEVEELTATVVELREQLATAERLLVKWLPKEPATWPIG